MGVGFGLGTLVPIGVFAGNSGGGTTLAATDDPPSSVPDWTDVMADGTRAHLWTRLGGTKDAPTIIGARYWRIEHPRDARCRFCRPRIPRAVETSIVQDP